MLYKRSPWAIIFAGLVFAALATCGDNDAKVENRAYCDAVDLWAESDGEYGHPDYKELYSEQCAVQNDHGHK